jgi:predicted amidohydrolase
MTEAWKIAGVQMDVTIGDTRANLAKMLEWFQSPSLAECRLVVFPECALSGYCFQSLQEAMPYTERLDGPAVEAFTRACQQGNRWVAYGFLERGDSGEIYNSLALVGRQGLQGVYRKVHLPYLGIDRFVTRGPDPFQVHHIDGLCVGMHICYDGSFPEASRAMALQGADLLLLPTNWPPGADTFARYLPNARALENNCYFMAVNRVGTERGFRFIGQSRLCDPNGHALADADESSQMAIIGQIDPAKARQKRLVRVPGEHVIDRFADRQPEYYGKLVEPHRLERRVDD